MSNYAQIRNMDISNGEGIGISVFFSGCDFRCKNCFNSELWDYNYGKPFANNEIQKIIELMDKPYIKRLSILGGDGLMSRNVESAMQLVKEVRKKFDNKKTIWLYTGYKWESILYPVVTDDFNPSRDQWLNFRRQIVGMCDVVVDGRYIDELRDLTLKWRGSENQRLIDVQKSLKENKVILYETN